MYLGTMFLSEFLLLLGPRYRIPATTMTALFITQPVECDGSAVFRTDRFHESSFTVHRYLGLLRTDRRRTGARGRRTPGRSPAAASWRTARRARTAPPRRRGCGTGTSLSLWGSSTRSLLAAHTRRPPNLRRPSRASRRGTAPRRVSLAPPRRGTSTVSNRPRSGRRESPSPPARRIPLQFALSTPRTRGYLRLASSDTARRTRCPAHPAGMPPVSYLPRMPPPRRRE